MAQKILDDHVVISRNPKPIIEDKPILDNKSLLGNKSIL